MVKQPGPDHMRWNDPISLHDGADVKPRHKTFKWGKKETYNVRAFTFWTASTFRTFHHPVSGKTRWKVHVPAISTLNWIWRHCQLIVRVCAFLKFFFIPEGPPFPFAPNEWLISYRVENYLSLSGPPLYQRPCLPSKRRSRCGLNFVFESSSC